MTPVPGRPRRVVLVTAEWAGDTWQVLVEPVGGEGFSAGYGDHVALAVENLDGDLVKWLDGTYPKARDDDAA